MKKLVGAISVVSLLLMGCAEQTPAEATVNPTTTPVQETTPADTAASPKETPAAPATTEVAKPKATVPATGKPAEKTAVGTKTESTVQPATQNRKSVMIDEKGGALTMYVGQVGFLTLEGNPTTGFDWHQKGTSDVVQVEFSGASSNVVSEGQVGAPANMEYIFTGKKKGKGKVVFEYKRSFEKDTPPAKTITWNVTVKE